MKFVGLFTGLVMLSACNPVDQNAQATVAEFQGETLRILWAPTTTGRRATVVVNHLNVNKLPTLDGNIAAFRNFFNQVTGCTVMEDEEIIITEAGGRPFSILVPYICE